MAHMSSYLFAEHKKFTLLSSTFNLQQSEQHAALRSYTEIRNKLHQTLQNRLAQGVSLKALSKLTKRPSPPQYRRVNLISPKRPGRLNLRVEATVASLALRPKTELPVSNHLPPLQDPVPTVLPALIPEELPVFEDSRIIEPAAETKDSIELDGKRLRSQRRDLSSLKPCRPLGLPKSVHLRDALKDRDWTSKARESVLKDLATAVNNSNGLEPVFQSNEPYKYCIIKGNNSKLVHQLMKTRPWWVRVKVMQDANFVWSQRRELEYISMIQTGEKGRFSIVENARISIGCPVKYFPQDSKIGHFVNIRSLGYDALTASPSSMKVGPASFYSPHSFKLHNRLEANFHLTNKKALYLNMKRYYNALGEDYSTYMPLTFHIVSGETDSEFLRFSKTFENQQFEDERNLWIVKPGENSNQGHDIVVCNALEQIKAEIRNSTCAKTGKRRTFIVQKYIERPFLYCKRKFDIRCYAMLTSLNGVVQGYFYTEGYIRTSCKEFSLKNIWDKYVHLTNDAVQKTSEDYGKYEHGNKLSYGDFQKYLDIHYAHLQLSFQDDILPQIKKLVQDTFKAAYFRVDPKCRTGSFEVLGYDFMLDWKLKPVLIEVNTNPCLALVSPLLLRLIPTMLDGAFRIVLDSLFPDNGSRRRGPENLPDTKWELIFHSLSDGSRLQTTLQDLGTLPSFLDSDPAVQDLADDDARESEGEPEDIGN